MSHDIIITLILVGVVIFTMTIVWSLRHILK